MTGDTRDPNDVKQDLKYDHRDLLTGMRVVKKSVGGDGYETYQLMYNYDEAGNRVRKRVYFYQGEDPTPVFEEDDMTGSWDLVGDEYYVRDVSGKEIAVYHSYDLDHWNVWGTDNVGKINANGDKFFYLKDHLGSVRVVLNSSNQIVSAIDYDCWGYPLENRSYQSDNIDYKFTGKQRDAETGGACPDMLLIGNYFGARYYDARIGRWGGVEPLLEKYISYSPYQYGLLNPMKLVDLDGRIIVPDEVKQNYPNLARYISNKFENVVMNNQSIIDAYTELTGLTEDELRVFVKDKSGPLLEITDLGYNKNKEKVDAHWLSAEDQQEKHGNDGFEGPYIAKLQLDKEYAKMIEDKLACGDKSEVINVKKLLKHTLTHEIAHGAHDKTKIWNGKDKEKGWVFEMKAYGYGYQYLNGHFQKMVFHDY